MKIRMKETDELDETTQDTFMTVPLSNNFIYYIIYRCTQKEILLFVVNVWLLQKKHCYLRFLDT
jgi:hypothetical protein